MRALLYDIHGNLPALEAVLEEAEEAGAGGYLLGGDYALFGAWPKETVGRLRELENADWVRGNGERWTAHPGDAPGEVQGAIVRCQELLGSAIATQLDGLPESVELDGTLFCHGSPVSDVRSFLPEPGADEAELLDGTAQRRIVFGHTHLAFARQAEDGRELVNPGSVGMPFDGDHRAAWAIMHDDGAIEQRRTSYDHEASAHAARTVLGDAGEVPARRIERAGFDAG